LKAGRSKHAERLRFNDKSYNEDWLQDLLFKHPDLLPAGEFDPVYRTLLPVTRELPTNAGPIDLLYVTPEGFLVLVETKLWRNPEARRKVVAQILDYTKEIAGWSYEELEEAVRRSSAAYKNTNLLDIARSQGELLEEIRFSDNVSKNLALGRFLLLIVGDGIREGVEGMAEFLQKTPNLGFTLGLVELAIYRLDDQPAPSLFVQPLVVARTREVTRAVVELDVPDGLLKVRVKLPPEPKPDGPKPPITETVFFEQLRKSADKAGGAVVAFAEWVLQNAHEHDLDVHWGKGGPLLRFVDEDSGEFFTLGQLNRHSQLRDVERLADRLKALALDDGIWRDYMDGIVGLVPGASRKEFTSKGTGNKYEAVVYGKNPGANSFLPLEKLAPKKEAWFDEIDKTVQRIRDALEEQRSSE